MKKQWNTGARYTEHGQRIVAETVDGGIIFNDIDRNIDGFISWRGRDVQESPSGLKEVVMFCYLRNHYQWDSRSCELKWEEI